MSFMKGAKICTVFGKFVPNFGMHNSKLHNYLVKVSQKFKHVYFMKGTKTCTVFRKIVCAFNLSY